MGVRESRMKSRSLADSFKYAIEGLKAAFVGERNFRIHCLMAVIAILFGIVFQIPAWKWVLLFLTIGFVLVCELVNTAGETLADMITTEYSPQAKKVKDLAAGAVLISAIVAVLAGCFIFIEPAFALIKSLLFTR